MGSCDLFTQEMIRNLEEHLNPRWIVAQIQAEQWLVAAQRRAEFLRHDHSQICPSCHQFNVKVSKEYLIY